ncbi:hypothetical protein [Phenylobacterium sp.]|uniref:hypothetical protein n=1 Tax=Phenylobacterium sp. TaxID=1871053 RepID=UPI002FDA1353
MTHPLQTKDAQWRDRPNAAEPVFDPGLSPPGTDSEAGGARSPLPDAGEAQPPLPAQPDNRAGVRLPPMFWIMVAAAMVAAVIVAASLSF